MAIVTIDSVVLPNDTIWLDQFDWNEINRNVQRTISGGLVFQTTVKDAGRPVTLDCGWVSRSTLATLEALRDNPTATTFTVVLADETAMTCSFHPDAESPVQVDPVFVRPEYIASDKMHLTLLLMLVDDNPETGTVSLVIDRGCDYARDFAFRSSTGAIIDLSGRTFAAQAREGADSTTTLIVNFTVTVDLATGIVTLSLTLAQTTALSASRGYWGLKETVDALTTTRSLGSILIRDTPTV